MRIAIEASCLQNRRGFGRFLRELLPALLARHPEHEWIALVDHPPEPGCAPPGLEVVRAEVGRPVTEAADAHGRRTLREMHGLAQVFRGIPADVYWYPAVYSFFPAPRRRAVVTTFHDTIAEQFPRLVFPNRRSQWAWGLKVRVAIRQSTRILTVSEAAKRDLVAHFRLSAERIDVTTEGPGAAFTRPVPPDEIGRLRGRIGLPPSAPYFLSVGGLSPHKNLRGLIGAFAVLDRPGVHLVIAGDPEGAGFLSHGSELRSQTTQSSLRERIHFPGYVSDLDLTALYAGAKALVFPSLAGGFGLPGVEAMVGGSPVRACDRGSLPEVVGPAGLRFDPTAPPAIAAAMRRILDEPDLREQLAVCARAQARRFTWERSADLVVESLKRAASECPRAR